MQTLIRKQKNLLTVAMVAALSVGGPRTRGDEKERPAKPAKAELAQLQLMVQVPPHWRPFLSDDLAEAFASRLNDVFGRRGYSGEIKFLDHAEARADTPALAIQLINWRIGRTDHAECAFTATLQNENEAHSLGVFESTSSTSGTIKPRWGAAQALGEVADAALRDLSTKLIQNGLLRGVFPTHS